MDRVYEISLLLDFYGQMLTQRQYEILDLHYNNDYSLGEIGEQLNISRQGVHDNIKRGKAVLNELEEKLGLVSKFSKQKERAHEVLQLLESMNSEAMSPIDRQKMTRIIEGINDIMNSI